MTEAESLHSYLSRALREVLGRKRYLGVDWLDKSPDSYSMDTVPASSVVKQYTGGGSQRQYEFILSSRRCYSADNLQNLDNLGFFDDLSAWIQDHSRAGDLPELSGKKTAMAVEVLNPGYLLSGEESRMGRYMMQCRMTYYQGV